MVKKNYDDIKPFSSNTGMLRTDRRTDRIAILITRVSVLTRDKNVFETETVSIIPNPTLSGARTRARDTVAADRSGSASCNVKVLPVDYAHAQNVYCVKLLEYNVLTQNIAEAVSGLQTIALRPRASLLKIAY